jgi:hypothetical protein
MGEPRQNFAMDAIQEFKVSTSTYKAEYGLATGGRGVGRHQVGTNQLHGSGLLFFRDASITAKEFFQTSQARLPALPVRRHDRRADRQEQDPLLLAYEGTDENQFFTVNARGLWPQFEGTFKSAQTRWTYNTKINHQLSSSQSLFFRYGAEEEYRPIITTGGRVTPSNSFDFAVPAALGRRRPLCRLERSCPERLPVPVRLREVRGGAALQPRQIRAGRLHGASPAAAPRSSATRRSRWAAAATRRWGLRGGGN